MVKYAFLARFEAKAGKEEALEQFLKNALPLAVEESEMVAWYAFRIGPASFGVFDTFENKSSQQAHLSAKIVTVLSELASELLIAPPIIENVELLAVKEKQDSEKARSYYPFG